jgi:pyruvate dehydrogenase E1 component alpha subunit
MWATERTRAGQGPTFIECCSYRWRGHHMGDQGDTYGYRNQKEIEEWMEKCPIQRFSEHLVSNQLATPERLEAIEAEVQKIIDDSVAFAKQSHYPDPSEVYTHVYA